MPEFEKLTPRDVTKLLQDPSPEHRALAAAKVSKAFSSNLMGEKERAIAEDIFRAMVRDAEIRVRAALSQSLKANASIPHDVAVSLAKDVAEVATPILEFSEVLTDEDLIEIVDNQAPEHQVAIAKRKKVSPQVSEALADTHNVDVVSALVSNKGARISERTMNKVIDEFGEDETVNGALAKRPQLPLKVAERLVTLVSESLRDYLVTHHELPPDMATDLIFESRERATVGLLEPGVDDIDVRALVNQLYDNRRLTPTLVVRALCMGDLLFFEESMARLADINVTSAYMLIHDKGELGLKALFQACGFPLSMMEIVRAALTVAAETDYDGRDGDRERFRDRMIERVLTQFETGFDSQNLDYLISRLGSHTEQRQAS